MEHRENSTRVVLERFRPYLRMLAETELTYQLKARVDVSDIVQETLLKAHQGIDRLRGTGEAQVAAWLRRILARVAANFRRDLHARKRDIRRERSLEAGLDRFSRRLEGLFARSQSSPSSSYRHAEILVRVSNALLSLPEDQRMALFLEHWEDLSLQEVGEKMGRSRAAVAGLVRRGLKSLRRELVDLG